MTEEKKDIRHPSFGVINVSRGVCSERMNLFGSSIQQRTYIQLSISKAVLTRHSTRDWIRSEGVPIVSIYLSPSQFAINSNVPESRRRNTMYNNFC